MEFLDEDDRQNAMRVARAAVVRAVASLAGTFAALIVALMTSTLIGLAMDLVALALAISSLVTLRHPQAAVIGGLRTLGLVIGGTVVLVGALQALYVTWLYVEWRLQEAPVVGQRVPSEPLHCGGNHAAIVAWIMLVRAA